MDKTSAECGKEYMERLRPRKLVKVPKSGIQCTREWRARISNKVLISQSLPSTSVSDALPTPINNASMTSQSTISEICPSAALLANEILSSQSSLSTSASQALSIPVNNTPTTSQSTVDEIHPSIASQQATRDFCYISKISQKESAPPHSVEQNSAANHKFPWLLDHTYCLQKDFRDELNGANSVNSLNNTIKSVARLGNESFVSFDNSSDYRDSSGEEEPFPLSELDIILLSSVEVEMEELEGEVHVHSSDDTSDRMLPLKKQGSLNVTSKRSKNASSVRNRKITAKPTQLKRKTSLKSNSPVIVTDLCKRNSHSTANYAIDTKKQETVNGSISSDRLVVSRGNQASCISLKNLEQENANLKKILRTMTQNNSKHVSEIKALRQQLTSAAQENKKMASKQLHMLVGNNMFSFLNDDQVEALSAKRSIKWSLKTIIRAKKLRATCGYAGYKELLSQGYPLPPLKILNRKIPQAEISDLVMDDSDCSDGGAEIGCHNI